MHGTFLGLHLPAYTEGTCSQHSKAVVVTKHYFVGNEASVGRKCIAFSMTKLSEREFRRSITVLLGLSVGVPHPALRNLQLQYPSVQPVSDRNG